MDESFSQSKSNLNQNCAVQHNRNNSVRVFPAETTLTHGSDGKEIPQPSLHIPCWLNAIAIYQLIELILVTFFTSLQIYASVTFEADLVKQNNAKTAGIIFTLRDIVLVVLTLLHSSLVVILTVIACTTRTDRKRILLKWWVIGCAITIVFNVLFLAYLIYGLYGIIIVQLYYADLEPELYESGPRILRSTIVVIAGVLVDILIRIFGIYGTKRLLKKCFFVNSC